MVKRKGLGQANILRTNNNTSTGYGIAYADEVSGHRTVANLTALYALNDWQLSASGDNTGSDAVGQLWYVVDADGNGNGCYYQLKDWSKRKEAAGWSEFIAQELGNSEKLVMSQKAVTDHLTKLENNNPYFFEDKKLGFIIQGVETDINWDYIEVYQYMNRKTTSEYLSQLLSLHAYVNSKTYDFSIGYKNNVVRTSKEIYELTSTTDSGVKIKLYVDWGALQNVAYTFMSPAIKINNSLIKVNYKTTIDNVESSLNNKITTLKEGIMYNYKGEVII